MEGKSKENNPQPKSESISSDMSDSAQLSGSGNKIYQNISNSTISDSSTILNINLASQDLDIQSLEEKIKEKEKFISWLYEAGHITLADEATTELKDLEQKRNQLIETLQKVKGSSTRLSSSGNSTKSYPPLKNYSKVSIGQELQEFQSILFKGLSKIPQSRITNDFHFIVIRVDEKGEEVYRFRGKSKCLGYDLDKNSGLDMAIIPEGHFLMESTESEAKDARKPKREKQKRVIVNSFCISRFPITKKQWSIIAKLEKIDRNLKVLPYRSGKLNSPITMISWLDAIEFCKRLSRYLDVEFRLPTEVEWEYACRAGTQSPFHFGPTITTALANYDGNYPYGSGPKGKSIGHPSHIDRYEFTNSFGLTDMHGNVFEWCIDKDLQKPSSTLHEHGYRLLRGGSWNSAPNSCRSAFRLSWPAQKAANWIGFRVALNLNL